MNGDVAVLFSGGVDSLSHLRWAQQKFGRQNVSAHYFDVGQAYADREIRRAEDLCRRLESRMLVHRPLVVPMHEEPGTAQIEYRNAFLLLWLAANREPRFSGIVFGMLRGEAPADKTRRFVRSIQALISETRLSAYATTPQPLTIHVPFAGHTKAEMVRWYLEQYGNEFLELSVGCFGATEPMCGACMSCFNRWLAWRENGLAAETYACDPADWMLFRLRSMWERPSSSDWQWATLPKAAARARWMLECRRQLNRRCRELYGVSALAAIRRGLAKPPHGAVL